MRQRKYTLPRHTNLAKNGARTGAFLIDLAITLAVTLLFVFAMFRPIFKNKVNGYQATIKEESISSGLYVKNEESGEAERISGKADYSVFVEALEKFYFEYMPSKYPEKAANYTMEWFNKDILLVGDETYNCFEYQKTDGEDDPSKLATRIEDASDNLVNKLVQGKYVDAIMDDLNNVPVVAKAGANYMTLSTLQYVASILIAGILSYIVMPLIFKNGQTVGKKVFGLGLANSDGYKLSNSRLLMRFLPFAVVDISLFFMILVNLYLVLLIVLIIFLVSFALAMSSPKRMSLHDITGRTIVVDLKTSTLFETIDQEEEFVLKEDNLLWEENERKDEDGEEPELRYEK